ncbi:MAG: type II and III secretion system protein [Sulfuricella sp.]|nr:type II and III secretion system protein [Sulfuricella sp.]
MNLPLKKNLTLFLLLGGLLGGCAGQQLHRDGMTLLNEGKVEEGLAKLDAAAKADPGNFSYRTAALRGREQALNRLIAGAANERIAEHREAARAIYQRVLTLDPDSRRAQEGLAQLAMDRRHDDQLADAENFLKKDDLDGARSAVKIVLTENPKNLRAATLQRQIDERALKEQLSAPGLGARFKKPVSLQFRDANLKMVFEALSRTSGINIVLDKDVKPELKISIFVKDVSVEDTIEMILLQSQLEKKIINDNTLFVYPNLPAKLKDYQDLKIRSFHLTNADPKQVLTMLKTLLKTKDVFIHEKTNSIVMRDTPDAIRIAEKLVADQDIADPEVMLEVEVLEVSRTRLSQIGIDYPNQVTFTAMGGAALAAAAAGGTTGTTTTTGSTPSSNAITLNDLRQLNGNRIATSPALAATINLKLQDGDANLLASPRIRVRNREKAKVMIGDRVPVITNAITPVSTGSPVVTGSVQYLDVGLKLEVEPDIHLDREVSIKLNLDVSSIIKEIANPVSGTLAYQIGTRNANTVLRLKDGETQILAGLINDEDRQTANMIPGLGQLPVLGRLFSSHGDDLKKTEIVLSITPRIVGTPRLPDMRETEYWTGTETGLRSAYQGLKPLGKIAVSAPTDMPLAALPAAPVMPAAAPPGVPAVPAPRPAPPQASTAASEPLELAWQGPSDAKVGDRVVVTLATPSGQGVRMVGCNLHFDPKVLKPFNILEGDLLKRGNTRSSFNKAIEADKGVIKVDLLGDAPSAPGPASIVTVGFEVVGADPQSSISVSQLTLAGAGGTKLNLHGPEPHALSVVP